eukprot:Platyproteum_vivax@DN5294_c0_g1_i2.p1
MHTETVFARVITFPKPTVAAINGHAFGGGALLFLCCDYRVMSPNKGFFCLNEMEIHAGFTPGLNEILMQKVDPHLYPELILQAKRYTGIEAEKFHMLHELVPLEKVEEAAIAKAKSMVKIGAFPFIYGSVKRHMYRHAHAMLAKEDYCYLGAMEATLQAMAKRAKAKL